MSGIPLIISILCYLWTAFEFYRNAKWNMGTVFIFYALSNVCFLIELWSAKE